MNESQKDESAREQLQTLSETSTATSTATRSPTRGLVRPELLTKITFIASFLSILLTAAGLLSAIWSFTDPRFTFQCIGSILVLLVALFIFRAINSQYEE